MEHIPKQSHCVRCPAFKLSCRSMCRSLAKNFEDLGFTALAWRIGCTSLSCVLFYRSSTCAEAGGSSFLKTLQSFISNLVRTKQVRYVDLIVWSIRMLLMTTEVGFVFSK